MISLPLPFHNPSLSPSNPRKIRIIGKSPSFGIAALATRCDITSFECPTAYITLPDNTCSIRRFLRRHLGFSGHRTFSRGLSKAPSPPRRARNGKYILFFASRTRQAGVFYRYHYLVYSRLASSIPSENQDGIITVSLPVDPNLPLLIWIDDDVVGNGPKVLEASKCGVTVIQLASTSAAKAWITINAGALQPHTSISQTIDVITKEFLKAHDSPAEIRFISDQVRIDTHSDRVAFENHNAGTETYHFIRGQGIKAPILVYTDRKSILLTHYVEKDEMAGSLNSHYKVFKEYVSALGAGRKGDRGWAKYNA